jgi:hypothetical protein
MNLGTGAFEWWDALEDHVEPEMFGTSWSGGGGREHSGLSRGSVFWNSGWCVGFGIRGRHGGLGGDRMRPLPDFGAFEWWDALEDHVGPGMFGYWGTYRVKLLLDGVDKSLTRGVFTK